MKYTNIDEDDIRLHSGIIGARKSAIIENGGHEKRSIRKDGLVERTKWKKLQSRRMKAIQNAKNNETFERESISLEDAIEKAIDKDQLLIVSENGDVSYLDSVDDIIPFMLTNE